MYHNICIYTYVCKCVYMCTYVYTYMCVFIYMYIHIPPNPLYAAHMLMTVKPSSGTWNMFKLPGATLLEKMGSSTPRSSQLSVAPQ